MSDERILKQIGMSDAEVRAYLKKLDQFFEALGPKEKRVFLAGMHTVQEALHSFQGNVTAEELLHFLKERTPPSATAVLGIEGRHDVYP